MPPAFLFPKRPGVPKGVRAALAFVFDLWAFEVIPASPGRPPIIVYEKIEGDVPLDGETEDAFRVYPHAVHVAKDQGIRGKGCYAPERSIRSRDIGPAIVIEEPASEFGERTFQSVSCANVRAGQRFSPFVPRHEEQGVPKMRQGVAKIDRDLAGRSDGDAVEDADLHGHIIRSIAEKG